MTNTKTTKHPLVGKYLLWAEPDFDEYEEPDGEIHREPNGSSYSIYRIAADLGSGFILADTLKLAPPHDPTGEQRIIALAQLTTAIEATVYDTLADHWKGRDPARTPPTPAPTPSLAGPVAGSA